MAEVCLLTGRPGTGKTTIIRTAISGLNVPAGGFYTGEIRVGSIRQGFIITTLDGRSGVLSHVNSPSPARVGKYGVNVDILDSIAVSSIHSAVDNGEVVVIDEIGKMELLSPLFREATLRAITSGNKVLASIMLDPQPFADKIKRAPGVKLIQLNTANRPYVLDQIQTWLQAGGHENNTENDR